MKSQHLSEEIIQDFVFNRSADPPVLEHMQGCEVCKAEVLVYQSLFAGIKEQAVAEFDFDLSESVLAGIEEKQSAKPVVLWLFGLLGVGVVLSVGFLFGKQIATMFSGVSEMTSYLVVTSAMVLGLFQAIELVRKYKKQLAAVDFG